MTNRELQKLGRRELLQLLLEQAKESERLGKLLKENDEQLKQLEESYERLRERLDKKDAQIHELKDALQAERDKREAELTERVNGGAAPLRQSAVPYMQAGQGQSVSSSVGAPTLLPGQAPRQQIPCGGQYQSQMPDPFPYQVPAQGQEPYPYQSQAPDPFPYPAPYQEAPAPDPYSAGMGGQYQYPPPRAERKRQGGQRSRMPFHLKKEQENGKTTLFFGWQHN